MIRDRLPPQPREWIDRGRTIDFQFEGGSCTGFAGDCISSALWASGVRMLGRSFKYHRPRGIYSLANHDVNDVVEDGVTTNIRADVTQICSGASYQAVNTFGGLKKDSARHIEHLSRMLPVGFYYKAFHTPRKLFPYWERKMRAMAGLGAINPKLPRARTPKDYDFCDVLVVGAGPAGLSASIAAAETGASVLVVDENLHPGGTLGYQWNSDASAARRFAQLMGKISSMPNVWIRTATEAAGLYADNWVALIDSVRLTKLRAGAVIVAAGCFEQPAVFKNNDLPGVMLASAAQRLIARYAVKPFQRGIVLVANSDGYCAAQDLLRAGVQLAAIVDLRKSPESPELVQPFNAARVPIFQQHAIYQARHASGKQGIIGAVICPIDDAGKTVTERAFKLECDGIAVSVGWMPADGLINQAGGKMKYSEQLHQYLPESLPEKVFAAGRVNGVYHLEAQLADGRRAGLAAAAAVGRNNGPVPEQARHEGPSPNHPYPVFPHPKGKAFVDLDEDVQYKDIVNAVQEGFDSIELIKRYTTIGMGPSQGKLANMNGVRILAKTRHQTVTQTGTTTSRPFYHPVPFGHLAGRSFHPHRLTAMHSRHQKAGAQFMPAGAWHRPAYYPAAGQGRDDAILAEVKTVRQGVGLIDVGTLGKIEVCGPDAAEFLERLYTGRFAKMRPGTTRYLLMCDESGVVIDDGVAGRLAEDRFYVTATTTGADAVYREMQRWAIIWGSSVTLANVTGQYAAMNLAGPYSRSILANLTDIKLDQDAFPYLGIREGVVAGAPARLMRVGFVGELGYEIHVPSQFGGHVWDRIMQQGAGFGIKPFGVEAQRILRLEKGHIIIGQDTDGLSSPYEAGMDWAVKMDKPFFVGQRSLQIIQKRPLQRALVGFTLPTDYAGPIPKECHLVIRGDQITGRVTSVAFSPSLNRVLGLAYVAKDQSGLGTKFTIRVDGRKEVEAEVVKTPFYDPDSRRQSETVEKPREAAA